jgi:hypothetical protein
MRYLRFFAFAAVALASTGCLRATYTLNLKPDGSGTIHQTMAMTAAAQSQAGMLMGADSGTLVPTEAKLRAAAAEMGKGVRYVSSSPYTAGGFKGVNAIYAFDDIRTLSLSMDKMMAAGMDTPTAQRAADAEVKLAFTPGPSSTTLKLMLPPLPKPTPEDEAKAREAAKQAGVPSKMPPEAEAMMKQLLTGLLVEVALNVNGTIVSTNAPYREGNKLVLLQLNGTELIKAGLNITQMMGMSGGNMQEQLLKTPGVKFVTLPEITITFR